MGLQNSYVLDLYTWIDYIYYTARKQVSEYLHVSFEPFAFLIF